MATPSSNTPPSTANAPTGIEQQAPQQAQAHQTSVPATPTTPPISPTPTTPKPVPQVSIPGAEHSKGVATHPTQTASPAQGPAPIPHTGPNTVASVGTHTNTPVPPNWKSASESRLGQVTAFYDKYAGKVGANPYFYFNKRVKPLKEKLEKFDSQFDFTNDKGEVVTKEQYSDQLYHDIQGLEMKESYAIHDPVANKQEQDRLEGVVADQKAGRKQVIIQ